MRKGRRAVGCYEVLLRRIAFESEETKSCTILRRMPFCTKKNWAIFFRTNDRLFRRIWPTNSVHLLRKSTSCFFYPSFVTDSNRNTRIGRFCTHTVYGISIEMLSQEHKNHQRINQVGGNPMHVHQHGQTKMSCCKQVHMLCTDPYKKNTVDVSIHADLKAPRVHLVFEKC